MRGKRRCVDAPVHHVEQAGGSPRTVPITQGIFSTAAARRLVPSRSRSSLRRAAVVTLEGDHDVASRDAIADAFSVAGTGRDLLVDLTDCTFIDSTIIKLLLQTMRPLEETGRALRARDRHRLPAATSRAWPS